MLGDAYTSTLGKHAQIIQAVTSKVVTNYPLLKYPHNVPESKQVFIREKDVTSLQVEKQINSNIVDLITKFVQQDLKNNNMLPEKIYIFNLFFFQTLDRKREMKVRKWWFTDFELLLIPVCSRYHSFLFVIDIQKGEFYILDSYVETIINYHEYAFGVVYNYMNKAYIQYTNKEDGLKWKTVKVHEQHNGYDCALYLAGNIEAILRNDVNKFRESIDSDNWVDESTSEKSMRSRSMTLTNIQYQMMFSPPAEKSIRSRWMTSAKYIGFFPEVASIRRKKNLKTSSLHSPTANNQTENDDIQYLGFFPKVASVKRKRILNVTDVKLSVDIPEQESDVYMDADLDLYDVNNTNVKLDMIRFCETLLSHYSIHTDPLENAFSVML